MSESPGRGWSAILRDLSDGVGLSDRDTTWAMDEIMAGSATDAQLAAFAVLLRAKRETPTELSGLVRSMLARTTPVPVTGRAVDVVGTGGDGAHTVNISTMAALVAAGSGRTVVKHGNRAASSRSGAADVLEALGVAIDLPADAVARTVREVGIGFCFAAVFHAGMRHAGAPRRELGIPTVFNFLGPLTNPAQPPAAAIGCSDVRMAPVMAAVLAARGADALVFRGEDGLDELSLAAPSRVWAVHDGSVTESMLDPAELGVSAAAADALRGGDAEHNADVVRRLLAGETGPVRDAVLLNAAAAIAAYDGELTDLPMALRRGLDEAARAIDSGATAQRLADWVTLSQSLRDHSAG